MFSIAKDVQVADSILKVGIVTPSDYDIQGAMPRPCAVETHARRYKESCPTNEDATALRRGVSRSPLQRKLPN